MSRSFTRYVGILGLTNIGLLNKGICRMGWPTDPNGYRALVVMGMKRRINLRTLHSDRNECEAAGLEYIACPIDQLSPPPLDRLRAIVNIIQPGDVFGCAFGSDRTGLIAYLYRIWVDGWTKDDAMEEFLSYVNPQTHFEIWPEIRERMEEVT